MPHLPPLSRAIENSPLAMAAVEGKSHIVRCVSPALCRLLGKKKEEMVGRPFSNAVPEGNGCLSHLDRVFRTGIAEVSAEQKRCGPNPAYWSYAVWAVSGADERPAGLMIQVADATEAAHFRGEVTAMNQELLIGSVRQHELTEAAERLNSELQREIVRRQGMEEELRSARDELELRVQERTAEVYRQARLMDLTHDAIIVRDLEGTIQYWNHGAAEMYGWRKEEALGKTMRHLLHTRFPAPREEITARIESEGRWEGELIQTRKDGSGIHVLSRATLQKDAQGRPLGVMLINYDISQRLFLEEQLRLAQTMEALGTLAGGIAHDFNNLLTPIIINTDLALMDIEEGHFPSAHHLGLVKTAATRGRELVQQIVGFSRQKEQRRKPMEITPLIRETLKVLKPALPESIEIRERMETESAVVLCNPIQIHQILLNLCTNASHAMAHRGGILEISLARAAPLIQGASNKNPCLHLAVKDTGHGMDPNTKEKALHPFFTTKKPGEGTGMGLAVVHGIVKNLEGSITIESEMGKGTTVNVFLPLVQGAGHDEPAVGPEPIPRGDERVLVVDEEEVQMRSIRSALERIGYRVVGKTDPREALETFRNG
ncbi:MAG TPA: PAS domain S-box protein, partial [Thermodesulfobacteriota bacterium]|nr:PAS domain S-box protein [Thermodesulfobacteriota bacterium]